MLLREQLSGDTYGRMEQLSARHTLSLDDTAMSMPYTQEMTRNVEIVEEVEEVDRPDTQTLKRRSRWCSYNNEEDKAFV